MSNSRVFLRFSEGLGADWGGGRGVLWVSKLYEGHFVISDQYSYRICAGKPATLIVLTVKSLFVSPNNVFEI